MQPKPMPTGFSVSSRISPSIARGSGREEFEILCRRAVDCLERDRGIESGQAAFVRDLKLEQINVRELPMTLNVIPSKASGFAHTHRVRPENMLTIRAEGPRARGRIFGRRAAAGRGRIGQCAHQRILRERTSRPSAGPIAPKPRDRGLVMDTRGIEQRNHDVYVEQSDHA